MAEIALTEPPEWVTSEADAYTYLETLRWPIRPVCPHCGSTKFHYFLRPSNGVSRETTRGSVSERRVWKCKECRKQFSVTTGTVFHGSKVSLRIWLFVFFAMCVHENGLAAREIAQSYDVDPRTAWYMTQRIREAIANDASGTLRGRMVVDETDADGTPKKWRTDETRQSKRAPRSRVRTVHLR